MARIKRKCHITCVCGTGNIHNMLARYMMPDTQEGPHSPHTTMQHGQALIDDVRLRTRFGGVSPAGW